MNLQLKKSIQDLLLNKTRTLLVIFALSLGLWGVSSIAISYFILRNDLNDNFLKTQPYHVALISKDFSRLNLDKFNQRPEIEAAEFRDLAFERVEAFPGKWLPLWIFGVENFSQFQIAQIYHEKGPLKPLPGTIFIERNGQLISNLKIGSIAKIRVAGKNINVPITGISFDPAQAPATQDAFIYAYTDKKTFTEITGEPINQKLIFRIRNAHSKQDIKDKVDQILNDLKNENINITGINLPEPDKHPHQFQLNTLLGLQGSMSLLAFLMGAILVSQLMESILTQQIRQIGILKAIGASRLQVFQIYLIMIISLGFISSCIAIPLAVLSGYGFSGFVAKILNFNILTTKLPLYLYLSLFILGISLPIILTFTTLWRVTKISVRSALATHGINEVQNENCFLFKLSRRLPSMAQLAIRNSLRRRKRFSITLATIALGVAIFNTGFNVRQSLINFLSDTKNSMKYDVQVVLKNEMSLDDALSPFTNIKNIQRIETWNGGRGRLQSNITSTINGIGLVALPHDTDLMKWDIYEGRWLNPSNEIEIVMNQAAADDFNEPVEIGKIYQLKLKDKPVSARLVGLVKEFDVAKIYIDKHQYDELINPDHHINSLMFLAKDRSQSSVVLLKKEIENILSQTNFDIFYVMSQTERAKIIYDHLNIILTLFTFLSALVLFVGALAMAAVTGTNIIERTREIGVMRALGATPKIIYTLFVVEGFITSCIGILIGLILAIPLSYYASAYFGHLILGHNISLQLAWSPMGFFITLFVTFTFGWLASRLPANQAMQISNQAALSYE